MPSARRQRLLSKKSKGKGFFSGLTKFLIPLLLLAAVWIGLRLDTRYWNGSDKFDFVYKQDNGDVAVTIFDPKLSESTTLIIPGDTQVNVAGNYGTLRLKNVWQLGLNEKLGGSLLAATVTKNFLSPVFLWSASDVGSVKFIFAPKNSNIPLGDRVAMTIFSLQVKSVDKTIVDLGKSQFLKKVNLSDGQPGYILNGPVSERITSYFSDNDFGDSGIKVDITDATDVNDSANIVGQIIEVMGGKVVSIDRKIAPSDSDCVVLGVSPKIVKKIARLFECSTSGEKSTFDLEIRLGAKFAKRF